MPHVSLGFILPLTSILLGPLRLFVSDVRCLLLYTMNQITTYYFALFWSDHVHVQLVALMFLWSFVQQRIWNCNTLVVFVSRIRC